MRDGQGQKCPVVVEGRDSDDWVVVHLGEDRTGTKTPLYASHSGLIQTSVLAGVH